MILRSGRPVIVSVAVVWSSLMMTTAKQVSIRPAASSRTLSTARALPSPDEPASMIRAWYGWLW
jgi:hypothetical protein